MGTGKDRHWMTEKKQLQQETFLVRLSKLLRRLEIKAWDEIDLT